MLHHFLRGARHFQGGGEQFLTAFCLKCLVNVLKDLAGVGVQLKLKVFMTSRLLIKGSELNAKVQVWLKLGGGLI